MKAFSEHIELMVLNNSSLNVNIDSISNFFKKISKLPTIYKTDCQENFLNPIKSETEGFFY